MSNRNEVINQLIRCETIFTRLYRKRTHVTSPACELMKGYHTDAPQSMMWQSHRGLPFRGPVAGSGGQSYMAPHCCQAQGPCVATEPSLEVQHVSRLDSFYLFSHLQTQAAPLRKGRWRLPGRKAGLTGTWGSHREMVLDLKGPWCQQASDMVAASAQDFIAGEPHCPMQRLG